MTEIVLIRLDTDEEGSPGILAHPFSKFRTLELPWRDNTPNLSSIPPRSFLPFGVYDVEKHNSPKFGRTLWVKGVDGRSGVLIHSGNWAGDVEKGLRTHSRGCILIGDRFGELHGQLAVLNSKASLMKLMIMLPDKLRLRIHGAERRAPHGFY